MLARSGDCRLAPAVDIRRVTEAPRRICHVASGDLWAGAEVQIATTASYLVERPDVDLSAVLFNEGVLACELRRLGIPVAVIEEQRHDAAQIVRFLARFLRDHDVEIVHTHRYKENVLGSLAAKLAGVPHVIRTVHGLAEPLSGWAGMKFRAYEALDKVALRFCADRIVAVSAQMVEALQSTGYPRAALVPIPNGVDLAKVRPMRARDAVRHELGVDSGVVLIGTAGRLSPVKAHDCFLRAARLIRQERRDARFVVVGDGPLKGELAGLARELRIERECLFPGARTDIFDLIAAMDIFVLPSLSEGIPMALLEAMALERPIVATAVGGVVAVVKDRTNGLLVNAGDERGLANACLELSRDREWARTIGARARQTVEEEFSQARSGRTLVGLYDAVAGQSPPADRHAYTGAARPGAFALSWLLVRGLATHGIRRLRHALDNRIERRRMRRIRRQPAALATALRSARNVLIVCHGNIIRSPFAARRIAQALGERAPVSISSAGLGAVPGRPPHPTAVEIAAPRSVDLTFHTARQVMPESVAESDLIFVMDVPQLVVFRKRFPQARAKTFLLTCLAPDAPLEIDDPVDGDESVFQACFDHISRATDPIVHLLSQAHPY
jgi:glycosyltransferase involved in cell wall biosynthesis/protein-tyrosine-phosphatase